MKTFTNLIDRYGRIIRVSIFRFNTLLLSYFLYFGLHNTNDGCNKKYIYIRKTYNIQRVIHKFPQRIYILSGKIQKKKLTIQAGKMEFFTLITQVSSRSDHPYGPSVQRRIDIGLH